MNKVILSVDAGGTKTKAALIDKNMKICYEEIGPCGSPAVLKEKALRNVFDLVRKVVRENKDKYDIAYIQMGISGLGVIDNKQYFEDALKAELGIEVSLENDVVIALYNTIKEKDEGIAVISGTGSACGIIHNGKITINGGWGNLLTEDGSGYTSVKTLMVNMIERYELTGEISPLSKKFMNLIGISNIHKLRTFTYFNDKFHVASYAKFINEEAKGDNEAKMILEHCGEQLARRIMRLYSEVNKNVILGIYGGFITESEIARTSMIKYINEHGYNPDIVLGEDPIYGGFYLSKRKGKIW